MLHRMPPVLFVSLMAFSLAGAARAQDAGLDVGDEAPAFEATTADEQTWRSEDYVGEKILVVYFYPAAMTGGCTKQACAFRDDRTTLTQLGAEVVGISGDPVRNLQVFKKAHRLNFTLLSDADGTIARAFGVPVRAGGTVKQQLEGTEVTLTRDLTTARWTFIIDRDGTIAYKDTEVDAAGDSKAVIAALKDMQGR
jgi:peroxiredoxin Q/BCP